jgi:hypothetical protein
MKHKFARYEKCSGLHGRILGEVFVKASSTFGTINELPQRPSNFSKDSMLAVDIDQIYIGSGYQFKQPERTQSRP